MKKKIIFLGFSLIISSCATTSQEIDQLEEQIVALENKENLTPEEEAELNQLIDKQEKLIEDDESVYEEIEMEDENENVDLNDSIFSKYYVKNDPDPKFNPGKFLERHCFYDGKYKDIYYEGTPLSDVPLDEDLKLDFYSFLNLKLNKHIINIVLILEILKHPIQYFYRLIKLFF